MSHLLTQLIAHKLEEDVKEPFEDPFFKDIFDLLYYLPNHSDISTLIWKFHPDTREKNQIYLGQFKGKNGLFKIKFCLFCS